MVASYEGALADIAAEKRDIVGKIRARMPCREYNGPLLDHIFEFQLKYPAIDLAHLPRVP